MVVDYQNGKIYKIIVNIENCDDCYVGSTCQSLCQRLAGHKSEYKYIKSIKSKKYISSYYLFDKYGVDNCKIILLENYPCSNKTELRQKEQYYIDLIPNVNQYKAHSGCLNKKEYIKAYQIVNNEKLSEYRKIYYEQNKDGLIKKQKEYQIQRKDLISERNKIYRDVNKEKLKQIIFCDCGGKYQHTHKSSHLKTKKHISFITNQ